MTLCDLMDCSLPWVSPSMGFSRPEYWSGLPFPSLGIFWTKGSNPGLPHCRQMLLLSEPPGKPRLVSVQYAIGGQWRNSSWKNEEMEPKWKRRWVVHVIGDWSQVWCCKQQYCIRTWNARSMNQGKLEVVKQEMSRVNINILGISELKWTRMGEFSSENHYIYYCGLESLGRKGVALIVNKRVLNAVHGCNLKNDRIISVQFQGKPFNITVIQVYVSITSAKEA